MAIRALFHAVRARIINIDKCQLRILKAFYIDPDNGLEFRGWQLKTCRPLLPPAEKIPNSKEAVGSNVQSDNFSAFQQTSV